MEKEPVHLCSQGNTSFLGSNNNKIHEMKNTDSAASVSADINNVLLISD